MSKAEKDRRERERRSAHSLALEGIILPLEILALRERVMTGEITEAEYRSIIIDMP
ncbi:hypothetical protein WNY59_09570 [Ahrensia kielensis]|uniref:SHOCT domain-containing protein n=1 Tax=Ahrensia kielensis TaxID=76980 RepID=A0ABU9T6U9_9HYPH